MSRYFSLLLLAILLTACARPAPAAQVPQMVEVTTVVEVEVTRVVEQVVVVTATPEPAPPTPEPTATAAAPTAEPAPTAAPEPTLAPIAPAVAEPGLPVASVLNGGNLRSDTVVAPNTVIGQVCPGDQVAVTGNQQVSGALWYRVKVTTAAANCDPSRVAVGTEGWLSSTLISQPSVVAAPNPTPVSEPAPPPAPAPEQRAIAPNCTEILTAKQRMTDIQWKNFKEGVKGTWLIDTSATIKEVESRSFLLGGYPIHIAISSDCDIYFVAPDEQTAVQFSKGQQVMVTAQVDFIDEGFFSGVTYHVEEFTVNIR